LSWSTDRIETQLSRGSAAATPAERRWSAALLGLVAGLLLGVMLMPGVSLERTLYLALHGICA